MQLASTLPQQTTSVVITTTSYKLGRKNDLRKHNAYIREQAAESDSSLIERSQPHASFEILKEEVQKHLPQHWTPVFSNTCINLCIMKVSPMSQPHIDRSININVDLSWHVNARGRILTQDSNNLLSRFPKKIDCIDSLTNAFTNEDLLHQHTLYSAVAIIKRTDFRTKTRSLDSTSPSINVNSSSTKLSSLELSTSLLSSPLQSKPSVAIVNYTEFRKLLC